MLTDEERNLIKEREFISVATCDFSHRPNAAPKFLLKLVKNDIYLVDYTIGTTWRNIKMNPRASLSFMDPKTLVGYQLNGPVEIIDKGPRYAKLTKEMEEKAIKLTAKHIIEHVRGEGEHKNLEVTIRDKFVVFKIRIEEAVRIGPKGELERGKA